MKLSFWGARLVFILGLVSVLFISQGLTVKARGNDTITTVAAGISNVISPISPLGMDANAAEVKAAESIDKSSSASSSSQPEATESRLVMANVSRAMNVREEPSEEANKVGVLYKDCGGKILERRDGWTKLQSGDLIGWAKDQYLLFDEDATALAADVGKQIVTSQCSALNVRAEASDKAEVLGEDLCRYDRGSGQWLDQCGLR